ncbi:MAG: phosphatase PAP2 family protein [Clostridia bacterium]|nr:phosphatase PAP2 family protein [Clostridia bacterium]
MTRETYRRITEQTRRLVSQLPGGAAILRLPTLIMACVYAGASVSVLMTRQLRSWPFFLVPAICFLTVTGLRILINRQRPYDRFHLPPVGRHVPDKGKSMPSRHAASAVAILMAVLSLHPPLPLALLLILLTALICFLRVAAGQHYPSDVLAGAALSVLLSLLLFPLCNSLSFPT